MRSAIAKPRREIDWVGGGRFAGLKESLDRIDSLIIDREDSRELAGHIRDAILAVAPKLPQNEEPIETIINQHLFSLGEAYYWI